MAKLYFRYGVMGSSKTAQALITKFNYEERGMSTLLLKPSIDTRDGENKVSSRIGLSSECIMISPDDDVYDVVSLYTDSVDVIIIDECQFLTSEQVDMLADIAAYEDIPVICYGLRTDFQTHLFPGSKRLFEIADSISEIKSVCKCGKKAIVNARLDKNGKIMIDGEQICIGGNDKYEPMCYTCYNERKEKDFS